MSDCLFCKIISGEIPSTKVYEDEKVYAFRDINPATPEHILVIPKKHISSIMDISEDDIELLGYMMVISKKIASDLGIDKDGFRIVNNCGEFGQQTVQHLHFHMLGGRQMQWPPG
jgi:histidine triad (HIT) family protein